MSALLTFDMEEVPLGKEYEGEILDHMRKVNGVTFYDSAYHVLALRMSGLYLSADLIYVKKAKRKGYAILYPEWECV